MGAAIGEGWLSDVYNAESSKSPKVVAGPIAATIYAKSSNRNLELIASLYDVSPSGTSTQISTGALIGSMRQLSKSGTWYSANKLVVKPDHPFDKDVYAKPNTVNRYDVELTPTLYTVAKGHQLRLVITTQGAATECANLLSALGTPLPCLLSAPQKKTVPGGTYRILWGGSFRSSINVALVAPSKLHVTKGAVTRTSNGAVEPIVW